MNAVRFLRRPGLLLAALLAAILGSLSLSAAPAHADDTVGIGISPVNAQGRPDGRSRFSYTVDPGRRVTDHVRISNEGTTRLKITVFATDAYNDDKGDFALRGEGDEKTGASDWVRFDGRKKLVLTLGRGESRTVPFTVAIPSDATPGDHPTGVLASATTPGQVTVERRIANRMYVRVSGDLQPLLTLSSFSGTYNCGWNPFDGSITTTATITNSGNVALEGVLTLSGSTWFGIGTGQVVRQELNEILPGNTATVTLDLKGVPQVGYATTTLLLQGGISGDAPDPGPLPVITRDAFVLAVPWLLLLVLAAGVGGWFWLRHRRRKEEAYATEWLAQAEAGARAKAGVGAGEAGGQ
ncbi:hypothetical protein PROP_02650 [Propionicimonas sp. T2.31MG-18]|uniref:COG1470 family protein n=1 Tax=Propionicimonas sp. T2.31MG-18 TaxID=3157620 RepID=UPI0035E4D8F4